MASPFKIRNITWTINNFTEDSIRKSFDEKARIASKWFKVASNEDTKEWSVHFFPNYSEGMCRLKMDEKKVEPGAPEFGSDDDDDDDDNMMADVKVNFQVDDNIVKHCSSFNLDLRKSEGFNFVSQKDLFEKFINNSYDEPALVMMLEIMVEKVNEQVQEENDFKKDAQYFNSHALSDFKIVCRDGVVLPAHRMILLRWPVFKAMITSDMLMKKRAQMTSDDIDSGGMLEVLRYLYTGKAQNLVRQVYQIIYAANKFDLPILKKLCVNNCILQISLKNVLKFYIIANKLNEYKLTEFSLSFIKQHYDELRITEEWKTLSIKLVQKLLDFSIKNPPLTFHTQLDAIMKDGDDEIAQGGGVVAPLTPCRCKGRCATKKCRCKRTNGYCSAACRCLGKCANVKKDEAEKL